MADEINTTPEEVSFDLRITNGAAKRLKNLMEHYHFDAAKDAVGLALELLEAVKNSHSIIVRQKDGTAKQLFIPTPKNDKTKE